MPGPTPKVDPDAQAAPKATVQSDPGLSKLYAQWQAREATNNKLLVQIAEYVRDQKISRAVLKKTLEERGLSASSVSSEVSRIFGLSKPENAPILQKLNEDEITVAAARKAIAKPQERPAQTAQDRLWKKLYEAARMAFNASATDTTFTEDYFVNEARSAWATVQSEYEEKEREAQAEAAKEEEAMAAGAV